MAYVNVSEIIIPDIWVPYSLQLTTELDNFIQSGIVATDEEFNTLSLGGGTTVQMPFFNDLVGTDTVIASGGTLVPEDMTTGRDVAALHNRQHAWSAEDLAGILAGSDPSGVFAQRNAYFWMRKRQQTLFSTLQGAFANASLAGLVNNIAFNGTGSIGTANYLTGSSLIDSTALLGDAQESLAAIAMHSQVEASLRKQDLIDFIPDSEGKTMISTFQGKRVIVNDLMPVTVSNGHNVYTSYIFGQGAVAYGDGGFNEPISGGFGTWRMEQARVALGGITNWISRVRFILHVRGIKWLNGATNALAGPSPSNTELTDPTNYTLVFQKKHIRVVQVQHNILGQ